MRVRIASGARADFCAAVEYYLEQPTDIAIRFADAYDAAVGNVREHPSRFAEYLPERYSNEYRYIAIPEFPFSVIYHVQSDELVVVAVAHASREPGYWTKDK